MSIDRRARIAELRESLNEKAGDLKFSQEDALKMLSGDMPYPQIIQVLMNCEMTDKYRHPNKRSLRDKGLSDSVMVLLKNITEQIDDVVWEEKLDELWISEDEIDPNTHAMLDGWTTHMKEYTGKLMWLIQHRATLGFPDEEFDIKQLYKHLLDVSRLSDSEIKEFILKEIPRAPWQWEMKVV